MVKLGDKVRDVITGFEGIAIGKSEWLCGCTTYGITPQKLKDGKIIDTEWFDEGRIEVIAEDVETYTENHRDPSGPQQIRREKNDRRKETNRRRT